MITRPAATAASVMTRSAAGRRPKSLVYPRTHAFLEVSGQGGDGLVGFIGAGGQVFLKRNLMIPAVVPHLQTEPRVPRVGGR